MGDRTVGGYEQPEEMDVVFKKQDVHRVEPASLRPWEVGRDRLKEPRGARVQENVAELSWTSGIS